MTRSNRVVNRVLLALVGLAFLTVAAWIANRYFAAVDVWAITVPETQWLWVAASTCLVLIVLAVVWIATRGGGRARTLVTATDDEGHGSIEARVAADLIADDLERIPDIVDVTARAFRVSGRIVLELVVTTRRAADVRLVVDSVGRAVASLDDVLATRIPVLLHVASGVRANLAHGQRVR